MTRSKAMTKARELSSMSVLDFYAYENPSGIWDVTVFKPDDNKAFFLQFFTYRSGEQIK